jgi:hypothetical protein
MEKRTFVGLHIPKCAGTTLLNRVESALPSDQIFQNTSIIRNFQRQNEDFLHIKAKQRLRFVWGHTVHEEMLKFFGPQAVLITGLREPIDRFKSELHYMVRLAQAQGRPRPDIVSHIRNVRNPMCRFLIERFPSIAGKTGTLADRAMNIIEAFHYVYFSDTFEETAGAIFNAMGISPDPISSNVAPEKSAEEFDIDLRQHEFDIKLYTHARARFQNLAPEIAFATKSPTLANFVAAPLNKQVLRDFMWKSSFYEYRNWKALPEVIEQKQQQIEELEYELAYYRTAMNPAGPVGGRPEKTDAGNADPA